MKFANQLRRRVIVRKCCSDNRNFLRRDGAMEALIIVTYDERFFQRNSRILSRLLNGMTTRRLRVERYSFHCRLQN